jgi:hypothetical protein
MIEAPHPVHTHTRSISYIHKVFQHLILWLVGVRMQCQPDIYVTVVVVGDSLGLGFSLVACVRL